MSFEIKVDEELSLRLVEPHHAEDLFAVADANREHIARWLPWMTPGYCVEDARAFCERALANFAKRQQLPLTMIVDGAIAGGVGLVAWSQEKLYDGSLDVSRAEMGYWLSASRTGRGLMTRAARAVTTYAFEEYGLRRLAITADADNAGSWRVAERLGYTHEGTHRDLGRHNGKRVDHKVYGMLAEDWTP